MSAAIPMSRKDMRSGKFTIVTHEQSNLYNKYINVEKTRTIHTTECCADKEIIFVRAIAPVILVSIFVATSLSLFGNESYPFEPLSLTSKGWFHDSNPGALETLVNVMPLEYERFMVHLIPTLLAFSSGHISYEGTLGGLVSAFVLAPQVTTYSFLWFYAVFAGLVIGFVLKLLVAQFDRFMICLRNYSKMSYAILNIFITNLSIDIIFITLLTMLTSWGVYEVQCRFNPWFLNALKNAAKSAQESDFPPITAVFVTLEQFFFPLYFNVVNGEDNLHSLTTGLHFNTGPALGLLTAYGLCGPAFVRRTIIPSIALLLFGGIPWMHILYAYMRPLTVLALMIGNMVAGVLLEAYDVKLSLNISSFPSVIELARENDSSTNKEGFVLAYVLSFATTIFFTVPILRCSWFKVCRRCNIAF